jgi:tRNA(fMet)-specific endonuclease VapC
VLIILDTDVFTLLQRRHPDLIRRIEERAKDETGNIVCTTVVTLQEQMQGRLARLNRVQPPDKLLLAYADLLKTLGIFSRMHVLPFDARCLEEFDRLRGLGVRIGPMDLRIASIALASGAKVITRNLRDFNRVPGLTAEDWTL